MKISIVFLLAVATILLASVQDCDAYPRGYFPGRSRETTAKPSTGDSTDTPVDSMAKDADAPMKPKEVKSESRTKTKTVYKTVYKTGKKTGKKTDEDEIPRSRKQRAIAAEQPELMDILKDIDLIFPIFRNRFWPPPQNQTQNPQQPQFFPQPQNPQQPLQRRPLLFPNLRLNAQQQANAKQLAASAAQYGQAILSALLHSTLPNAALADSIAAAAGGGATDLASTFIKNHAEPEAEEAPAAEVAEPAAEPESLF